MSSYYNNDTLIEQDILITELRQQLAEAQADRDAIKKELEKAYEIGMLAKQQLASCQAALADTEALEIGTGERLAKVEQQLAAAIAARVSAQASGIRLLDQLTEAKEECDTLRRIHAENIAILERKTAQAVAACKLRDEAISDFLKQYPHMTKGYVLDALAIQPDDDALKAWIGEPVAWMITYDGKCMGFVPTEEANTVAVYSPKGLK